jgi:hypothetical protein
MRTAIEVIDKLNCYSFHDMPLDSIGITTETGTRLNINAKTFDEKTEGYIHLKISFIDIQKLISNSLYLTKNSDMEIYSFEYEFKDVFKCRITLLTGSAEPGLTIELDCLTIEINNCKEYISTDE